MIASYLMIASIAVGCGGAAMAQEPDWAAVDAALGRKAAVTADVHRYGFPQTDLAVTLDGVRSSPASRWADGSRSSRCTAGRW